MSNKGMMQELGLNAKMARSTKGASKQWRDQINARIQELRDLLPLPYAVRQRLSQLQLMALVCVYVRKNRFFSSQVLPFGACAACQFEFSKSLSGFVLAVARSGKLLYITENAADYLGHTMVDLMTQGDTIYDITEGSDHKTIRTELESKVAPNVDLKFLFRMSFRSSMKRQGKIGDQKVFLARGHFVPAVKKDQEPVFMGVCTPILTPESKLAGVHGSTMIFSSAHMLDMKYLYTDQIGHHHLGYPNGELCGMSWYNLIHPDDAEMAMNKHKQLLHGTEDEENCMILLRLLSKSGRWMWVHVVMQLRRSVLANNTQPVIVCTNQVIGEEEAGILSEARWLYETPPTTPELFSDCDSLAGSNKSAESLQHPLHIKATWPSADYACSAISPGSNSISSVSSCGEPSSVISQNCVLDETNWSVITQGKRKADAGEIQHSPCEKLPKLEDCDGLPADAAKVLVQSGNLPSYIPAPLTPESAEGGESKGNIANLSQTNIQMSKTDLIINSLPLTPDSLDDRASDMDTSIDQLVPKLSTVISLEILNSPESIVQDTVEKKSVINKSASNLPVLDPDAIDGFLGGLRSEIDLKPTPLMLSRLILGIDDYTEQPSINKLKWKSQQQSATMLQKYFDSLDEMRHTCTVPEQSRDMLTHQTNYHRDLTVLSEFDDYSRNPPSNGPEPELYQLDEEQFFNSLQRQ